MGWMNKAADELTSFSGSWNGCVDVTAYKAVGLGLGLGLGLKRAASIYSNGSGRYLSSACRYSSPEDSLAKSLNFPCFDSPEAQTVRSMSGARVQHLSPAGTPLESLWVPGQCCRMRHIMLGNGDGIQPFPQHCKVTINPWPKCHIPHSL